MLKLFVTLALLITTTASHAGVGEFLFTTAQSVDAWRAGLEPQTRKVDNVEWHYYARHLEQDTCTVLVHGFTAEASHWLRFARQLEPSRCLIIPDLPGFGASSYDASESYAIPKQAARLRDFLDAVKPQVKLNMVGSSMGGHISTTFTLENLQRVATLTLFDAGGVVSANKSPAGITLETTGKPIFHVAEREAFYRLMASNLNDGPWIPGVVMEFLADRFIARNERHMRIFSQIHGQDRVDARLGEITAPTLIVWGADDKVLDKSMGERYAALIKGSQHHVLEGVGHLPFLERPAEAATLFEGFIGKR